MARVFALLQPDGTLLTARPKGNGWDVSDQLSGIEARGRNLTVFLNGLDALGLNAVIPAGNEKEARRAAPFAVEDDLAESIEDSHVALSEPNKADPGAPREINVMSNETLSVLIDGLSAQGFEEAELVAAHSVLPKQDMLFAAPGLILGRLGSRSFAIDPALGQDVLISMAEGYPEASVHGDQIARALGRVPESPGATSLEALLIRLATWVEEGQPFVRLRQGAFESRRQVDFGGFGQWKLAGALAAVAGMGWFGSVLLETNAMNQRVESLSALTEEFARVGWPEVNGDAQQVLALAQNSNVDLSQPFIDLLDASAVLYDGIEQVEGSEIQTLRYDRLRRQMTATVAFESFADVDRLTAILSNAGINARSGDSRQSGSRVIGDLTLEASS